MVLTLLITCVNMCQLGTGYFLDGFQGDGASWNGVERRENTSPYLVGRSKGGREGKAPLSLSLSLSEWGSLNSIMIL